MSPAEYRAKWRAASMKAMSRAVLDGEDIPQAAERIHRRFHRAVPVHELVVTGSYGLAYLDKRRPKPHRWAPQWQGDGYGAGRG